MMRSREHTPAERLRSLLEEASPHIERLTRSVCPTCTDVCCRQKHGEFTDGDRAYLAALREAVPPHDPARDPEGPCQFLGGGGCSKPRWQRAWKCTWYFCDALLAALNDGPQKEARQLSSALEEIGRLYDAIGGGEHAEQAGH